MNHNIKSLNTELEILETAVKDTKYKLQSEWNLIFDDLGSIKDLIKELDNSKTYVWDKYDEISSEIDFDLASFKDCREYFVNYMRDTHFAEVNFDQNQVTASVGHSIVINGYGDVYDQDDGKFFVSKKDYVNENGVADIDKRDSMIEAYMEKNGCYPSVFQCNEYGNLSLVNTKR